MRKNTSSKWGTRPGTGLRSRADMKRSRGVMVRGYPYRATHVDMQICLVVLIGCRGSFLVIENWARPHDGRSHKGTRNGEPAGIRCKVNGTRIVSISPTGLLVWGRNVPGPRASRSAQAIIDRAVGAPDQHCRFLRSQPSDMLTYVLKDHRPSATCFESTGRSRRL